MSMLQNYLHSSDSIQATYAARIFGKLGPRENNYKTITNLHPIKQHKETFEHPLLDLYEKNEVKMRKEQVIQIASGALMDKLSVNRRSPSCNCKEISCNSFIPVMFS